MVVVWLVRFLKSMGEMGESNDASVVAFGREMHLAGMDCLPIASRSLWEPLGQDSVKCSTRRVRLDRCISY